MASGHRQGFAGGSTHCDWKSLDCVDLPSVPVYFCLLGKLELGKLTHLQVVAGCNVCNGHLFTHQFSIDSIAKDCFKY